MQELNGNYIIGLEGNQVAITSGVMKALKAVQKDGNYQKEQGGILVGYYDSLIDSLVISDITYPQSQDACSQFRFSRKSHGHQSIMDDLWEESGHRKSYLGEWHTHNQYFPVPSSIDTRNWRKISKREHNFDENYYVIVGTQNIGVWCIKQGNLIELGYI